MRMDQNIGGIGNIIAEENNIQMSVNNLSGGVFNRSGRKICCSKTLNHEKVHVDNIRCFILLVQEFSKFIHIPPNNNLNINNNINNNNTNNNSNSIGLNGLNSFNQMNQLNKASVARSTTTLISSQYILSSQKDNKFPQYRSRLLVWLYELNSYFRYKNYEVFHLAVNLLDRVCSRFNIKLCSLQALGAACFLIAAKYCEPRPPPMSSLTNLAAGAFDINHLKKMELDILKVLKWEIVAPTPDLFLEYFMPMIFSHPKSFYQVYMKWATKDQREQFVSEVYKRAHKFLYFMQLDFFYVGFLPSILAAAALVMSYSSCVCYFIEALLQQRQEQIESRCFHNNINHEKQSCNCYCNHKLEILTILDKLSLNNNINNNESDIKDIIHKMLEETLTQTYEHNKHNHNQININKSLPSPIKTINDYDFYNSNSNKIQIPDWAQPCSNNNTSFLDSSKSDVLSYMDQLNLNGNNNNNGLMSSNSSIYSSQSINTNNSSANIKNLPFRRPSTDSLNLALTDSGIGFNPIIRSPSSLNQLNQPLSSSSSTSSHSSTYSFSSYSNIPNSILSIEHQRRRSNSNTNNNNNNQSFVYLQQQQQQQPDNSNTNIELTYPLIKHIDGKAIKDVISGNCCGFCCRCSLNKDKNNNNNNVSSIDVSIDESNKENIDNKKNESVNIKEEEEKKRITAMHGMVILAMLKADLGETNINKEDVIQEARSLLLDGFKDMDNKRQLLRPISMNRILNINNQNRHMSYLNQNLNNNYQQNNNQNNHYINIINNDRSKTPDSGFLDDYDESQFTEDDFFVAKLVSAKALKPEIGDEFRYRSTINDTAEELYDTLNKLGLSEERFFSDVNLPDMAQILLCNSHLQLKLQELEDFHFVNVASWRN